jgi:hypothetical protein
VPRVGSAGTGRGVLAKISALGFSEVAIIQ